MCFQIFGASSFQLFQLEYCICFKPQAVFFLPSFFPFSFSSSFLFPFPSSLIKMLQPFLYEVQDAILLWPNYTLFLLSIQLRISRIIMFWILNTVGVIYFSSAGGQNHPYFFQAFEKYSCLLSPYGIFRVQLSSLKLYVPKHSSSYNARLGGAELGFSCCLNLLWHQTIELKTQLSPNFSVLIFSTLNLLF